MESISKSSGEIDGNKSKIKEVQTGLFVSCKKTKTVLQMVERMLWQKFHTEAIAGPPRPSGTCEILLRSPSSSLVVANFKESKVYSNSIKFLPDCGQTELLENYLNILKESRPNFVFIKEQEVINIDEEDDVKIVKTKDNFFDDSVIVLDTSANETLPTIEVIELDLSDGEESGCEASQLLCEDVKNRAKKSPTTSSENSDNNLAQSTLRSPVSKVLTCAKCNKQSPDRSVICLDCTEEENSTRFLDNSEPNKLGEKFCGRGVKRKRDLEEERFEIINIDDNEDVTFVGDSFSKAKSTDISLSHGCSKAAETLIVTVEDDCRTVSSEVFKDSLSREGTSVIGCSDPNSTNSANSNAVSSSSGSDLVCRPPKKPSKFAYKRLAHLVPPLTQTVLDSSRAASQSSSGFSNIYNPNEGLQEKRTGLRPVVIDGNNVGVSHGKGQFSVRGVQICINYFEKRGHRQIKAFIPNYRKRREVHDILDKMERQGTVVITPSRRVEGKTVAPYDDRYIVQYAVEVGGVIVTTDHYRDLLGENLGWKETIEKRLLMFNWVDDMLMFPQDPLGRTGPSLDEFLKFPD